MIWVRGVEYGTAAQLADRFGVTIWTIYKWRSLYGLATHRIGGVDYSPVPEAAQIDREARHATRGRQRQLDAATAAA